MQLEFLVLSIPSKLSGKSSGLAIQALFRALIRLARLWTGLWSCWPDRKQCVDQTISKPYLHPDSLRGSQFAPSVPPKSVWSRFSQAPCQNYPLITPTDWCKRVMCIWLPPCLFSHFGSHIHITLFPFIFHSIFLFIFPQNLSIAV